MKTTIQALLIIISIVFFACQQNDNIQPATDLTVMQLKSATLAVNDVAVENVSDEVNFETYFYGEYEQLLRALAHTRGNNRDLMAGKGNLHYVNGMHPAVSIDKTDDSYPDYGTGIETKHGKVIKGKVVIVISGPRKVDGSTRTITYTNCEIDSIGINGTCTETFNGDNLATRMITVDSNVDFTLPDGTVLTREGINVRKWLQGLDTPMERDDDMIQITGTINITSSASDKYARVISSDNPLIRLGDCQHPVQGTVTFYKNDAEIASLDYGDGTCDNLAELTTGDTIVEIEMKEHKMPKAKTEGQHKHMEGNMGGNGKSGH